MTHPAPSVDSFIQRWAASGAAERANYQLFLSELCALLDVPPPDPTRPDDADNAYVFERNVHFPEDDGTTTIGRIDLYKRSAFVLEAKQGSDAATADEEAAAALQSEKSKKPKRRGTAVRGTKSWDDAMVKARGQADRYARALPVAEGWPPFLLVVDVGHSIELYSEFSRSGKTYVPFPDPKSFRILLDDLRRDEIRARLRQVWLDPLPLDPSRRAARVTRELAERLAKLAKLLEAESHHPEDVARFLMRCLFTMFAEDVELIPRGSFEDLLGGLLDAPENFKPAAEDLWRTMNTGGFSPILRKRLLRFNGGLFAESDALPLTKPMLELLHEAAGADWTDVEPAIFGTLLERALSTTERHKLGAHYTPRAYVERLVLPTVIEPLREDWQAAYAAAVTAAKQGDLAAAQETVRAFHEQLCKTRVLDPACGSGNFLYVTLEQMKRLEGEVLNALQEFGDTQSILFEVDPHQFLGIEVNPRAAAIAELVLWIGYLQWHFRTRGKTIPAEPIIKNYRNIECRDAVLAWDRKEIVLDKELKPVTRWDGRTMKVHPVTGEDVPDESARMLVERYVNPRKAEWPEAEYVVGNPPFIGNWRIRSAVGEGYAEAIRQAHCDVPESCDYVMYWWDHAAHLTRQGAIRRFGLITTNSIRQTFSRRVLQSHMTGKPPLSLMFAVPDHPWVDSEDGAAVRIAMTVAAVSERPGELFRVLTETPTEGEGLEVTLGSQIGTIQADLSIGANVAGACGLEANSGISCRGVSLHGAGFIVTPEEASQLGLGRIDGLEGHIRPYLNGRDMTSNSRNVLVIDLFGLTADEVRRQFPDVYQWIANRVKPERDQNNRDSYRNNWWIFGEARGNFRPALKGLRRYISTVETAKHRFFVFLDGKILPDNMLVNIALDDASFLGFLSSRVHVVFALASGGTLEDRPRYNKTRCFDPFPFPICIDSQKSRIRELAEQLDAHRKRQQALHPTLTLTGMYNVLEKLRAGEELTAKDKAIHEQGLVSVLRQIHDDLDAAVFDAYGWPATLADEEILERLVALNAERAAEEAAGLVRWLRPEFQNPTAISEQQQTLSLADDDAEEGQPTTKVAKGKAANKADKQEWPKGRAAQAKAVLAILRDCNALVTADELAQRFSRAPRETIDELLQALVTLGQARQTRGKYTC
ncbi:MAG: DNA methyltransferase [Planctomycetota bacterium]